MDYNIFSTTERMRNTAHVNLINRLRCWAYNNVLCLSVASPHDIPFTFEESLRNWAKMLVIETSDAIKEKSSWGNISITWIKLSFAVAVYLF